jgi:single-strand DNA-binding protein
MASFNKVILAGNLTRDPELTHTPSNVAICKFGLAANRRWRDKNSGENKEEVCFVDCVAFGRSGEVITQYLTKGRNILIEGRLNFRQWEAQDGTKRSKHEIVVETFQFLSDGSGQGGQGARGGQGGAQAASGQGSSGPAARRTPSATAPPPPPDEPPIEDYGPPVDDHGVPF